MTDSTELIDVAIIGSGPAGTQAALVLARARKSVIVFDEKRPPRNADSRGMHNVLGMDGLLPSEIRDIAWHQIAVYGGAEKRQAEVLRVDQDGSVFVLHTSDGRKTRARTVIAAFGYRDVLPDIPGFSACWSSRIIPCPFCDGYENRGGRWGVVVGSAMEADVFPPLAANWADRVIVLVPADLELPSELARSWKEKGFDVAQGRIERIHHRDEVLLAVTLDTGERVEVDTLLWQPPKQRVPLLDRIVDDLGLKTTDDGIVVTDDNFETNVPGLFAVGDLLGWMGALGSAHTANVAASHIVRSWFR